MGTFDHILDHVHMDQVKLTQKPVKVRCYKIQFLILKIHKTQFLLEISFKTSILRKNSLFSIITPFKITQFDHWVVAQGKIHIKLEKVWFLQLRTIVYFRQKSLLQNVTDCFKLFQIVTNVTGCSKYLNIFMSFKNVLMQQIFDRFSKSQNFKIENSKIWSRELDGSFNDMFIKIDWENWLIEQFLLIETMLFTQCVACDMNATVIIIYC